MISLNRKLIEDDIDDGHPYNTYGPQLATPLMSRQIENGMHYTMFTNQFRMTAGVEGVVFNAMLRRAPAE